jgi:chorismate mutase
MTEKLFQLRDEIDQIDEKLVILLARRFALTSEIGRIKKQHQLPASDPTREATQMARIASIAEQHNLDPSVAQKILRTIIDEVVSQHQQI